MASARNHRLKPAALARGSTEETVRLTQQFCAEHLNAEYGELCAKLVGRLARKHASPLLMPPEVISPEISIPYGFPKPGTYRIFLQIKRAGRVETVVFDTLVQ